MKVLFSGGGTAGHINPALSIAGYIEKKQSNVEILFVGNQGGMEENLVPKNGYKIELINISGFQRKLTPKNIVRNVKTVFRIFKSSAQAKKIIRDFKPDVCIGTGGYVCGPVLREAAKLGIPCVVHESNSYPGVTIKMLSKKMSAVMLPNEATKKYFDESVNTVVTGNPFCGDILAFDKIESRKKLGFDERPLIVSFGGSLGAKAINEAMLPLLKKSLKDGKFQHIHGYGFSKNNAYFAEKVKEFEGSNSVRVLEYINNMPECLAAADLIISRSGAMTISEISAMSKASILIPSPNVAENHQYHNAMSLVNLGGAVVLEEKDLTPKRLEEEVEKILATKESLETYSKNANKLFVPDVEEKIYNTIIKAVKS